MTSGPKVAKRAACFAVPHQDQLAHIYYIVVHRRDIFNIFNATSSLQTTKSNAKLHFLPPLKIFTQRPPYFQTEYARYAFPEDARRSPRSSLLETIRRAVATGPFIVLFEEATHWCEPSLYLFKAAAHFGKAWRRLFYRF